MVLALQTVILHLPIVLAQILQFLEVNIATSLNALLDAIMEVFVLLLMFAIALVLDIMEVLAPFQFAAQSVLTEEVALVQTLAIAKELDTSVSLAKLLFALETVVLVLALLLKRAIAESAVTTEPTAKPPFAKILASMDFALDQILAIATVLDSLAALVMFHFVFLDVPMLDFALHQTLAIVLLDGTELLALFQSVLSLATTEESALDPTLATVQELDTLELIAQRM